MVWLNLLIHHHRGEKKVFSVVRVPSEKEEDRRHLLREVRTLKREKTRTTNRIKGLLATQGVQVTRLDLPDAQLDAIRIWNRNGLEDGLKSRLKIEWQR